MAIVLGMDIGGSGMKAAPINIETGELVGERYRLPTPMKARPNDMAEIVTKLAAHFEWNGPIGFGFPAVIRKGVAYSAANIDEAWIGTRVEDLFSKATGCPCYVLNDADAAGLAEIKFGAGKDYPKGEIIMITIGTGLGTAIFVDGKLVPNTELGHLVIRGKDAEVRASDAARQKKKLSWQKWSQRLTEYLQYVERLFSPDLIVLGGGVSKLADEFIPELELHTEVIPAQLLNQAGMIGAALYAGMRAQEDKAKA